MVIVRFRSRGLLFGRRALEEGTRKQGMRSVDTENGYQKSAGGDTKRLEAWANEHGLELEFGAGVLRWLSGISRRRELGWI